MKNKIVIAMPLLAFFAAAQPPLPSYTVTDLGTLGGPFSTASNVAGSGVVSGAAALPDGSQHAVLWKMGVAQDIGQPGLGGSNSFAFGSNQNGQAAGEAESSIADPNAENFCGFGTNFICSPFLWQNGVMTALPTLGGPNAFVDGFNQHGDAIGAAENTTPDPSCPAPQVLQFKPAYWHNGKIQELPTVLGDVDGAAFGMNDNGQAVGATGICSTLNTQSLINFIGVHPVLWQNGTATYLGTLGGTAPAGEGSPGNVALAVNNLSQVVGVSDLPGDKNSHGFLWTKTTGMQDLGTVPGDSSSGALAINDAGQIVGVSVDANGNPRASIRQNGVMTDLNSLIPADSPLYLLLAASVNSNGQVAGLGVTNDGQTHAFLLTPQVSIVVNAPGAIGANSFQTILSSFSLSAAQSTSPNPGPLSYSWTASPGYPPAAILSGNTATPIVQFSYRGTYQLTLTVTDSAGITATTTVTLEYV